LKEKKQDQVIMGHLKKQLADAQKGTSREEGRKEEGRKEEGRKEEGKDERKGTRRDNNRTNSSSGQIKTNEATWDGEFQGTPFRLVQMKDKNVEKSQVDERLIALCEKDPELLFIAILNNNQVP
jgi:hypothetical protein